jgi:hypothetical protein
MVVLGAARESGAILSRISGRKTAKPLSTARHAVLPGFMLRVARVDF